MQLVGCTARMYRHSCFISKWDTPYRVFMIQMDSLIASFQVITPSQVCMNFYLVFISPSPLSLSRRVCDVYEGGCIYIYDVYVCIRSMCMYGKGTYNE